MKMIAALLLCALPAACFASSVSVPNVGAAITSLQQLNAVLENGPNKRMGFLSDANFNSVHTVLSKKVEPVIFTDTDDIYEAVTSGDIIAALISGVPDRTRFSVFSSDLVSPRSFQMMPGSASDHLMEAVDAAVVRTHHAGAVLKAQIANPPFEAIEVHTCRADDPEKVPFPEAATATGLLKDVLDTKTLRVLGYGTEDDKPDWHQDGNYKVNPPTGFWPHYMNSFMAQFKAAYGDDIKLERVWMKAGGTDAVLNGTIHMTEPYYVYENMYNDELKKWNHRFSCVVAGYDKKFFSKAPEVKVLSDGEEGSTDCPRDLSVCQANRLKNAIVSRDGLNAALESGSNRKMGFLSEANYRSMAPVLSDKVSHVIYSSTHELEQAVANGSVIAGMISGVPGDEFNSFSTDMISPRSFQMMPGDRSRHLMEAVDAAVVRTHNAAELQEAQRANPPFQLVEVHTCRSDDPAKVQFPSADSATGLLKDVLETRKLKILSYGTPDALPNWAQDGNYQVEPATGFWPDYMRKFMAHFKTVYGNDIELERVWMKAGGTDMVLNGTIHMTEPYYIYENLWQDRLKKWSHEFSCVVLGYEQQFFARKAQLDFSEAGATCEEQLAACTMNPVPVSAADEQQSVVVASLLSIAGVMAVLQQ